MLRTPPQGERLEGENAYQLDDTRDEAGKKVPGIKVDAQKRICLGKLPSTLIIQASPAGISTSTPLPTPLPTPLTTPLTMSVAPG